MLLAVLQVSLLLAASAPDPARPARAAAPARPAPPAAPDLTPTPPPLPPPPPSAAQLAPRPVGPRGLRIALPDPQVGGDLPVRLRAVFVQALLAEVRKLEGVSAIGASEIRDMLSFEYQRQMMGCQADDRCLAEIAGALGVDEIVTTELAVTASSLVLTMKRIGLRTARVTADSQQRLQRTSGGEELLGAVGPAVQALFSDRLLRPGRTRGVAKEVALRLNPPPLPRWVFWATTGAALAAAAGGTSYALLSGDSRKQYNALVRTSGTSVVPGAQLKSLDAQARSRASSANLLFATAGAFALAAGVEAFFTDWHGYRTSVGVAPGPGGAQLQISGVLP